MTTCSDRSNNKDASSGFHHVSDILLHPSPNCLHKSDKLCRITMGLSLSFLFSPEFGNGVKMSSWMNWNDVERKWQDWTNKGGGGYCREMQLPRSVRHIEADDEKFLSVFVGQDVPSKSSPVLLYYIYRLSCSVYRCGDCLPGTDSLHHNLSMFFFHPFVPFFFVRPRSGCSSKTLVFLDVGSDGLYCWLSFSSWAQKEKSKKKNRKKGKRGGRLFVCAFLHRVSVILTLLWSRWKWSRADEAEATQRKDSFSFSSSLDCFTL